jgi:hypothetical protein
MHAIVRPSRIDIEGANAVEAEVWQPMLAAGPSGRIDGFIYRTTPMADEDVVRILRKYGIDANTEADLASSG